MADNRILIAKFIHPRQAKTAPLYQYDYGQMLKFIGVSLPDTYEVHFSNSDDMGTAYTVLGNANGVMIPDSLLVTGNPIHAWIFLHDTDADGETEYKVDIPVIRRPKVTDAEPTPVQQDIITQTIAALNAGVERAEQAADGIEETIETALQEAKDSGEFDGEDGYTPVKGVDYFDGKDGEPGKDGATGPAGISPSVTVTDIEGGHRITITDADGPHGIDVMNGELGPKGDTGEAGYTPVRGVDYWTAEDQQAITADAVGHGVTGASVGDIIKVSAVDVNGVPTAWERADVYPKKVFEYAFDGNWTKISVVSINHETGEIELEPNDAGFTDDYNTTWCISAVPILNYSSAWQYGFMPKELYRSYGTGQRGVLSAQNTIKIYTSSTQTISSFTQSSNENLSEWQIWAHPLLHDGSKQSVSCSGLLTDHRYKVIAYTPCNPVGSSPVIELFRTESSGMGYISQGLGLNGNSASFFSKSFNRYDTIDSRSINGNYLLPSLATADFWCLSEETFIAHCTVGCFSWFNANPADNSKPSFFSTVGYCYGHFRKAGTMTIGFAGNAGGWQLAIDGARVVVYDLGTV